MPDRVNRDQGRHVVPLCCHSVGVNLQRTKCEVLDSVANKMKMIVNIKIDKIPSLILIPIDITVVLVACIKGEEYLE